MFFFQNGLIPIMQAAEVGNAAVCRELLAYHGDEQVKTQRKVSEMCNK